MKLRDTLLPIAGALSLGGLVHAQAAETNAGQVRVTAEAEYAERMREAEQRLAEAARRVAELSSERLNRYGDMQSHAFGIPDKPRLGVNIGDDGGNEAVEGVKVLSVTPGSAASDAGLRAGDFITAVNDEPMSAENSLEAAKLLLDFMQNVEEGDVLKVEYLRDGKVGSVEIEPRRTDSEIFAWVGSDVVPGMPVPEMHASPETLEHFRLRYGGWRRSWGDMEVVELSEGLGRYFGTGEGLLVISAPKSNAFKLQDGDVIQSIDGRQPKSVNHCMRILGSYQPGEKLLLNIMRDKRREKLEVEIPDDRTG